MPLTVFLYDALGPQDLSKEGLFVDVTRNLPDLRFVFLGDERPVRQLKRSRVRLLNELRVLIVLKYLCRPLRILEDVLRLLLNLFGLLLL
jgi:hypothetical protein